MGVDEKKFRMKRSKQLTRALKFAVISLAAIVLVYTPVIWSLMPPLESREVTLPQAFLFVLQTITTVGYGSFLPFQSWVMNLLAALLMVSGISMVFFVITNLVAHWVNEAISPTPSTETELEEHLIFTDHNGLVQNFMESLEEMRRRVSSRVSS